MFSQRNVHVPHCTCSCFSGERGKHLFGAFVLRVRRRNNFSNPFELRRSISSPLDDKHAELERDSEPFNPVKITTQLMLSLWAFTKWFETLDVKVRTAMKDFFSLAASCLEGLFVASYSFFVFLDMCGD